MEQNEFNTQIKLFWKGLCLFIIAITFAGGLIALYALYPNNNLFRDKEPAQNNIESSDTLLASKADSSNIVDGIHVETGFVQDVGMTEVINNCTNCHSAKLVTQNRMSREAWLATIKWMQETQNLWDLGENQSVILDYLAKNYAPQDKGRRQNLKIDNWYELQQ